MRNYSLGKQYILGEFVLLKNQEYMSILNILHFLDYAHFERKQNHLIFCGSYLHYWFENDEFWRITYIRKCIEIKERALIKAKTTTRVFGAFWQIILSELLKTNEDKCLSKKSNDGSKSNFWMSMPSIGDTIVYLHRNFNSRVIKIA